ncbi:hypothetical protein TBS_32440 [Thermobispora bispora]|nr:hypothetical protein [Thermobispora bispora]
MVSVLAGSLVVSGATAASAKANPTLGPYGYGTLKLGMSLKQARATGLLVQKFPGRGGGCSGWDLKKFRTPKNKAGVWISPRVGVAAIYAGKGMKTPRGIRLGSTFRQLKVAYPGIKKDMYGLYRVRVPGNSKAQYAFEVKRGKVTEFGILLRNQDCFG